MKRTTLFLITCITASCVASEAGDGGQGEPETQSLTDAKDYGLELMLPFLPGESRTLTQAYETDGTHRRHGPAHWDDSHALDFAGDGCSSWDRPVTAAEGGVALTLPKDLAPGTDGARAYEASYGPYTVILDHGGGCFSQYAHLRSRSVRDGEFVARGQEIGREGNLGTAAGASCAAHPGTHLHFKVWCGDHAIVPEPMSGYHGLKGFVGSVFAHRALHHPPGTLVKTAGRPDIYLLIGNGRKRRITDEKVWRSYRFFQDRAHEWATVVTVTKEELACHDDDPDIAAHARIVATTCGRGTFIAFEAEGVRWRKRIPFEPSQAGRRILLRSWGFHPNEVVNSDPWACAISESTQTLTLRDGTVIERASDDDFFVAAGDVAYPLRRELISVLYGHAWPMVIQVPDGPLQGLVASVAPREFSLNDMTACPNRRATLETTLADGTGGGRPTPMPEPDPPPVPSPPADDPSPPYLPEPRTIHCERAGTTFALSVTGPLDGALVGKDIPDPIGIEVGSDRFGWSGADIGFAWSGDRDANGDLKVYRLGYPADIGRFNLYAVGADGDIGWFDLPDADQNGIAFSIEGDCRMVCAPDSCAIALE